MENNTLTRIESFIEKHRRENIKIDGIEFIMGNINLIKPISGIMLGEFRAELIFSGKMDDEQP